MNTRNNSCLHIAVSVNDAAKFRVNNPDKLKNYMNGRDSVTLCRLVTESLYRYQGENENDDFPGLLNGVVLFVSLIGLRVPAGNAVSSDSRIYHEGRQTAHPRNCFRGDGWQRLRQTVLHNSS